MERRVRQLEHELAYAKQEVEFLKKIQQADMEARKQWESKKRRK
ncbi:MAG: HTH domain-containing protein [Acutalibacteraceae bacterium]